MNDLTPEQNRVVSFMLEYRQKNGVLPTFREIADGLGYKSINNVRQHLKLIEKKGHIRLLQGKARGIEILHEPFLGYNEEDGTEVPIIGTVAAGCPITAIENVDGYITLDKAYFKGPGLFALRIHGDSMEGIGVLNGDIAIIKQKSNAEHNEVIVAIIDGEATLKRFIRENGKLLLRAENPNYADIILSPHSSIQIAGKLAGVLRKY